MQLNIDTSCHVPEDNSAIYEYRSGCIHSFYPFLNPVNSPGTNPTAAAIGSPDAETADGYAANCVAVLLSA
jgi:hypothetical protein